MIVAIEGGIATYQYCNGDILKPEFKEKMIEASIKGGTVGGSVGVSILLGASPGGPVVFAVGTGAYIITEVGIALWKEHQAKKYLTIADLEAFGIKLDTTLELPYEDILTHDTTLELPKDTTLELKEDTTLSLF